MAPLALGKKFGWNWALALMAALAGCASADNPYGMPPMLAGQVRLDGSLTDAVGNPIGTKVTINTGGVRVWLIEAGQAVDSTLTANGVYLFHMKKNHAYRAQVGIRPAFVDSSEVVTPVRDIGYYPDTLRLARSGDLTSSPNPFTGQVRLSFRLAADTQLVLEIYDLSAKRVRVLASQTFPAGAHQFLWDGKDDSANAVPDGMYWVLFQSPSETRAELLIKQP